MSVVDEVKERIDIVEVVGETVDLRKSGKNYTGFCPFHSNTRTPAFVVFPDTGTWRCFGACNEGGDVFSFLMKKEGFDFPEALRLLAERAGVELRPLTPEQEAQAEENEHLRELLEAATTFYRHQLLQTSAGEPVLAYLHGRGLDDEAIEVFQLGYAPDSWDAALGYFREKGHSDEDLVDAGLVSERETGGYYDRFRHRLMIPIRDTRGRMVGFGARSVDPEDVPKYLNSPQTPLFDKGRLLYGLDKARKAIRTQDQAVIVEGYMDVIGLYQAGYQNAVSPMGTALSESQLRQLKRYSRNIVLALDADTAGDRATLRGLDIARQAMDREPDPVFAARGLVRYEGRLDAELRIVTLPAEKDPDEVVLESPEAWPELLDGAQTVVEYVMDALSAGRDLDDPKHKAAIAEQVLPLIEDVADPVEREAYRQMLARRLKVDERALMAYRRGGAGRRVGGDRSESTPKGGPRHDTIERFCLGVLLQRPDLIYRIDRELQELELERITEDDFGGADRRMIFKTLRTAIGQHDVEPREHWRQQLQPPLDELAEELVSAIPPMALDQPRVAGGVLASFYNLRKRRLTSRANEIQFRLLSAQENEEGEMDDTGVDRLKREVKLLAVELQKLDLVLATPGHNWTSVSQGTW
ncbi:MAG: DNA primase [Anaerolineales bacterium]